MLGSSKDFSSSLDILDQMSSFRSSNLFYSMDCFSASVSVIFAIIQQLNPLKLAPIYAVVFPVWFKDDRMVLGLCL